MPANLENSAVATGLESSVFIPIPKKGNAKECSNYHTIALISHASKVMLKILQARLQQYVNHELPDVQDWFRKDKGTRDQIAKIHWIIEKAGDFQKNIYFCFIDYAKDLTMWITINCGKFWKRWEYQICLLRNPVVMYGCESWNVKKAERQRIDVFELWCWRRLLRVPWTARRSTNPFWMRSALGFLWREWC